MTKKKNKKVLVISSMEIWEMRKPKYDAYVCGHGAHGSKGYNRRKIKEQFKCEEWQLILVNSDPAQRVKIL